MNQTGHAKLRIGADLHQDIADMVLDWGEAGLLGEAKERPLHRIPLVADRDVREAGGEEVGLEIALWGEGPGHGKRYHIMVRLPRIPDSQQSRGFNHAI